MAPYLIIALIGLLYILFFGLLSYFRREGVSMRFIIEALIVTALATAATWATGWDLNPAIFVIVLYLITMRVRILVDLGNLLARRKDYAMAERVYGLAERLWPDEPGRLLVKLNRGVMAVFRADTGLAIAALQEVLAASGGGFMSAKSTAACHYNLGVAYLREGHDAQATLEFNRVLEDWPMTEYARYARIALERRRRATSAAKVDETPVDLP
jgi:tetratricopeptide (TPR) repeat protein